MPFRDPIVSGNTLVREAIQSGNYVAGVAGWKISSNGDAEFNSVAVRGWFNTQTTGITRHIEINRPRVSPLIPQPGQIEFFSDDPNEFSAAVIGATWTSGDPNPYLNLISPTVLADRSRTQIVMRAPNNGAAGTGLISASTNGASRAVFELSTILGGMVFLAPLMRTVQGQFITGSGTVSTTSVAYVAVNAATSFTMPYPASGSIKVDLDAFMVNSAAAPAFSELGFEIRDTNAAGTLRQAAADVHAAGLQNMPANAGATCALSRTITGLPTTGTMYVSLMMRSSVATNTASVYCPTLNVTPLP